MAYGDMIFALIRQAFDAGGLGQLRGQPTLNIRKRFTVAEVNAGATLVPAPGVGFKLRMIDYNMQAIGGAASGATDVRLLGTRAASSVALTIVTAGALTQSAPNKVGTANNTILADGASFTQLDANTPITIGKTGGTLATATHVDVVISYAADKI